MDNIYIIIQGYYSDWKAVGYCENEEEAKIICKTFNSMKQEYDYEWWYKEVNPFSFLDNKMSNISQIKLYRKFKVLIYQEPDWNVYAESFEYENVLSYEIPPKKICKDEKGYFMTIYVEPEADDYYDGGTKAEKIAYDFLMQYLAEHGGTLDEIV